MSKKKTLALAEIEKTPLSLVKMDPSELQQFVGGLEKALQADEAAKIRICECCIQIS